MHYFRALSLTHSGLTGVAFGQRLSGFSDKKISLSPSGKSPLEARPSRAHKEGRIAIVTDVGAGCDGRSLMRWTSAAKADGEVVWS
jgi:hypothetical protein